VILLALLQAPHAMKTLTEREWDLAVPQARRSGLLARLAELAQRQGFYDGLMERPRQHLKAAQRLAAKHRRDVLYELDQIQQILGSLLGTIVLLKGAAYLAANFQPAAGRVFSDIDILVPEEKIAAVEALLRLAGWRDDGTDPYDDRYYRLWMHQIPPLTHAERQSTIDVHHSIVPKTARIGAVTAEPLLKRMVTLHDLPGFAILAPEDMLLHSATHLFNEGEFHNGLRDLSDLDLLFRQFGTEAEFWSKLSRRAVELGLTRPLFYALRYSGSMIGTPLPAETVHASAEFGPPGPMLKIMDVCFKRALAPHHESCQGFASKPVLFFLYVRAQYLRMPLHLLVPHLVRKALRIGRTPGTSEAN
jgi:hypothetical protein